MVSFCQLPIFFQSMFKSSIVWFCCVVLFVFPRWGESLLSTISIVGCFFLWISPITYLENSLEYKTLELQECLLRGENICLYTQVNSTLY